MQRFYAALCFMLTGGIPGLCLILYDLVQRGKIETKLSFVVLLYIIIPVFLAGFFGFVLGADILNPDKVRSARHAAARGLYVSLAAWIAFAPIMSAMVGTKFNMSFFHKLALVLLVGSVIVGWLIAGVGVATGLVLYRLRKPHLASGPYSE